MVAHLAQGYTPRPHGKDNAQCHDQSERKASRRKAHALYRDWIALDGAVRHREAKYGWSHTPGPMRWDEDRKVAVSASKAERHASRTAQQHPTGAAAKFEHYHDEESLQSYIRREVAPQVRTLLTRQSASWEALHHFLRNLIYAGKRGSRRVHSPRNQPHHPRESIRCIPS
jgi:hypothetical protein